MKPVFNYPDRKVYQEFKETFRTPLQGYFNGLFGFDVVAFDAYVGTPDGTSLADHLTKVYGEQAYAMIETLVSIPVSEAYPPTVAEALASPH